MRTMIIVLSCLFTLSFHGVAQAGCSESVTPITTGWDLTGKVQGEVRPIGRYDVATFDAADGQQLCVVSTLNNETRVHQFKCDEGRLEFVQRVSSPKSSECHKVQEGTLRVLDAKPPVADWLRSVGRAR